MPFIDIGAVLFTDNLHIPIKVYITVAIQSNAISTFKSTKKWVIFKTFHKLLKTPISSHQFLNFTNQLNLDQFITYTMFKTIS